MIWYFENGDYSRQSLSNGLVVWKGQDLGEETIRLVWLKQRVNKGESWTWTKIGENHECEPKDFIFQLESSREQ